MNGAVMNQDRTPLRSERQRTFIVNLSAERGREVPSNLDELSVAQASQLITTLLAQPRKPEAARARAATQPAVDEGMYILEGVIYKVQRAVHGSGKLYAKKLVANEFGRSSFVYVPGAVFKLTPADKLTKQEAQNWGALYGTCCRCGRTLTAEDSIERMMGPVCYGKMGW